MTWAKLDDGFFDHPKARAAGKDGRSLFLASLCHCAHNLTDGLVQPHDLPLLAVEAGVKATVARKLVEVGLWREVPEGWLIRDFLQYNPSAESVKAGRWAAAERKKARRCKPSLIDRDGATCRRCGTEDEIVIDHLLPLSRGGGSNPSNLALLCQPCNNAKGALTWDEWLAREEAIAMGRPST